MSYYTLKTDGLKINQIYNPGLSNLDWVKINYCYYYKPFGQLWFKMFSTMGTFTRDITHIICKHYLPRSQIIRFRFITIRDTNVSRGNFDPLMVMFQICESKILSLYAGLTAVELESRAVYTSEARIDATSEASSAP